jgi:protein involved in polysaccharide export with SLBB domain
MKTLIQLIALTLALTITTQVQAQNAILKPSDSVNVELKVPAEDATNVTSLGLAISPQGTIKLSYIGEVQAVGLTPTQLARRIEAAYKAAEIYTNPTIHVNIAPNSQAGGAAHIVTVGGEVKSGGKEVALRDGMTLYQAIMAAGGFTEFADTRRVKLIRKGSETLIDMKKTGARGAASMLLQDGDVIHVAQD